MKKMYVSVLTLAIMMAVIGCSVLCAADSIPQADPISTAADWARNPDVALQAILNENQRLGNLVEEYRSMGSWLAWAGGALTLLLGMARMFPGVTQPFAEILYNLWATRQSKAQEKKRDVLAQGFTEVAGIMRTFPPDSKLGDVIGKLNTNLPEEVKQAYRDWEKHEAKPRPSASNVDPLVAAAAAIMRAAASPGGGVPPVVAPVVTASNPTGG